VRATLELRRRVERKELRRLAVSVARVGEPIGASGGAVGEARAGGGLQQQFFSEIALSSDIVVRWRASDEKFGEQGSSFSACWNSIQSTGIQ
jgi:hypothetical protein